MTDWPLGTNKNKPFLETVSKTTTPPNQWELRVAFSWQRCITPGWLPSRTRQVR